LEYDRVGRRTKRTLPNSVVTEWQYDWRDRVTNITHKISSTVLASVGYERLAGGEPSKITREDGSYVELKYDNALRLTNEVYFTNSVAQTTNSYAYDASGSRVKLVKGGLAYTNTVSGGYRVTQVLTNGVLAESYSYDNGGRVTQIGRDGLTLNLGYNTLDQVQAVTNGGNWVTYAHDGSGRRTFSTNNGSVVRKFLVAPTPGSDLESPHLIANVSGSVQQGYVYLGDDPILRFATSGTAAYYLEDGMGSVIGIAPATSPGTGNTTRLFYDGFGNTRATNGPAPTFPSGTGGDFRFHGAWLEADSGLYHMRAREYDARMGRFTSRDPDAGNFKVPETLQPYVFANNNAHIFTDPSGAFSLIEINISSLYQASLQSFRGVGIAKARSKLLKMIGKAVRDELVNQLKNFFPVPDMLSSFNKARDFSDLLMDYFCREFPAKDRLYLEVPVTPDGTPRGNGFNCNKGIDQDRLMELVRLGIPRPDFIFGPKAPKSREGGINKTWLVGELKSTLATLYNDYKAPEDPQFNAIVYYASKHTYSHVALFVCAIPGRMKDGKPPSEDVIKSIILTKGVLKGAVPLVLVIIDK